MQLLPFLSAKLQKKSQKCKKNAYYFDENFVPFELCSKVLPLGKTQIYLVFLSLIRTFAA